VVRRLGWRAIVIGDRGLGRKELLIRLAHADQAYVFRVDPDILVGAPGAPPSERLDAYLARQPALGRARWQRGSEPALDCTVRAATATLRYSRTGRQAEYTEATVQFVAWRPDDPPPRAARARHDAARDDAAASRRDRLGLWATVECGNRV